AFEVGTGKASHPRAVSIFSSLSPRASIVQGRGAWPYSGDALEACRGLLKALGKAVGEVEEQLAKI
ncbi:MAG TPA: hypothetical protein VNI20_10960, partial [Fimbriimonadaceae bacterium]|nr:hypothetical protein [Fimbriimonadaceae bacterium]